jgi:hypothetical protein
MMELNFRISAGEADRFCGWLTGIGGWAPSNGIEPPVVHRLLRIVNPENTVGIPRQDLVVMQVEESRHFQIRSEFRPLFEAWQAYDISRRLHKEV